MNCQRRHDVAAQFRVSHLCPCAAIAVGLGLSGCQTYSPQPLDVAAHRHALQERLVDPAPLHDYLASLHAGSLQQPDDFSIDDGLSAAEGEVVGLFYNPDLRIARLEAGVTRASYETAGMWDDPVFAFNGAEILSPSGPLEYGLMLNFTIPISGRLELEKQRAGTTLAASLDAVAALEWQTRANVRRAWAQWSAATEHASLLRELIDELERIIAVTGRLAEAGELTRADERVFAITLANQQAALLEVDAMVKQRRTDLLYLLGLPMDADLTLQQGLHRLEIPDLADPEQRLIDHNTTLAVRRVEYQIAEDTLRLEIRKQFPDIELGGGYGDEGDDRLLLGVSVPIPLLSGNRAAIERAAANRDLARAVAETSFEQIARDLVHARLQYEQARDRLQQGLGVPLATDQLEELERLAELGEIDTLLLLQAVNGLFEAKQRLLQTMLAEQLATIRIVELLGPPAEPEATRDLKEQDS